MFFVMLSTINRIPIPLVTEEQDYYPALFVTKQEAEASAEDTLLGQAYGYQVYEWA